MWSGTQQDFVVKTGFLWEWKEKEKVTVLINGTVYFEPLRCKSQR